MENKADKSIIVYAITEKGPDIVHASSNLPQSRIQEISLYHLLLVAQGTWHHKGVFLLPIPVNNLNLTHKAIYFGFEIFDPEQKDPRTNGTRYGCVITFVPNDILATTDLISLEKSFNTFFSKIKTFQALKQKALFTKLQTFIKKNVFPKKKKAKVITQLN